MKLLLTVRVTQWIECQTSNLEVVGSTPIADFFCISIPAKLSKELIKCDISYTDIKCTQIHVEILVPYKEVIRDLLDIIVSRGIPDDISNCHIYTQNLIKKRI